MTDHDFDTSVDRAGLIRQYAEALEAKKKHVAKLVTEEQLQFLVYGKNGRSYTRFREALRRGVSPTAYIRDELDWMFGTLIDNRHREAILYVAEHMREYPYAKSYNRRSFRSESLGAYTDRLVGMLRNFTCFNLVEAELPDILDRRLPADMQAYLDEHRWFTCGYNRWQVAYALDTRDERTEAAVRRILTDGGAGSLHNDLICGVLCSHRADLHELLGQLLLAARLQEGLRQAICENADCGTKEGFLTILRVIEDNDLIRFSSVKRAVGTWLGILTEEVRDLERVSHKSVTLIHECLSDPAARAAHLASEDCMRIHIALWSMAFDCVESTFGEIERMADEGTHHQILTAGYFVQNLDEPLAAHRIAKSVLRRLAADGHTASDLMAVWLPNFLSQPVNILWEYAYQNGKLNAKAYFDTPAELDEFDTLLKHLYAGMKGKAETFSPCVFPWFTARYAKSDLAARICAMATLSQEADRMDAACAYLKECEAMRRDLIFCALLKHPATQTQRNAVLEGLADKAVDTRHRAYNCAKGLTLSAAEYRSIEGHLRFKAADIRETVMALLMKQDDQALAACIIRLLDSGKKEPRYAALDMLVQLSKTSDRSAVVSPFRDRLTAMKADETVTAEEKILLDVLVPQAEETADDLVPLCTEADRYVPTDFDEAYTARSVATFTRYFPDSRFPQMPVGKGKPSLLVKLAKAVAGKECKTRVRAAEDIVSLSQLIYKHKNDPVPSVWGDGETAPLGSSGAGLGDCNLENIPLADLWNGWYAERDMTPERILRAALLAFACERGKPFADACAASVDDLLGDGFSCPVSMPFAQHTIRFLQYLCVTHVSEADREELAYATAWWFLHCVPDDRVLVPDVRYGQTPGPLEMSHLLGHPQICELFAYLHCENDDRLPATFPVAVAVAQRCSDAWNALPWKEALAERPWVSTEDFTTRLRMPVSGVGYQTGPDLVGSAAYLLAAHRGLITERQLFAFILSPAHLKSALISISSLASFHREADRRVTAKNTGYFDSDLYRARIVKALLTNKTEYTVAMKDPAEVAALAEKHGAFVAYVDKVYATMVPYLLAIELKRGDSPTPYSAGLCGVRRIYGAEPFTSILHAMGSDTIVRGAYFGWGNSTDRRGVFSHLLAVCIPDTDDTVETLEKALAGKKITRKRLIEAALFSPEWIPLVGEYLGIPGFESVCYYFMAHMNERFDDKRRALIARYTPLTEEELNVGAFDINWFRAAHAAMDEKTFDLIYDAAKYISDGARHARARKYADAALGGYDPTETRKLVADKRNKDLLMAYALIPLADEDDLCRRYLYIQQFRKESKNFGSQRSVSEGKAADMALYNLAMNAGYADVMRLTLRMETKVMDDSRDLFEPHTLEGVTLRLVLDEAGKTELTVEKDGKALKAVPAKLKKHETVTALSEGKKMLTEQYRRARIMLEQAMEDGVMFTMAEINALAAHPVVFPMLRRLVLLAKDTDAHGFPDGRGLTDHAGNEHILPPDAPVTVAHPHDLYAKGIWTAYQSRLFEQGTVQPFRQVFRELYVKTAEERESDTSLRYAGNQIQPAKTVATLKSRRWVADVENGLQKVYYKENLVAQIYAMADWFTPADIEAPTLEYVGFSDRRTGQPVKIKDVPDVIFSEVMRDVDLAVSVAHAGGVDPETSHSTVEMREALLSFILPMLGVTNVRVEKAHAFIEGKLGEYAVHLGSGVVHQIGGTMIPVLPVHSQHRGKIFLPFADEDPKTAEIVSKVLLFADDAGIKDPTILDAIQRKY